MTVYNKTLTNNTITSIFEISLPSNTMLGAQVVSTITATDNTNYQSLTRGLYITAVNKAGTITNDVNTEGDSNSKAVSSGTLSDTWSVTNGSNKITFTITAASSLTASPTIYYRVQEFTGKTITIL